VPIERLDRWLAGFAERHGEVDVSPGAESVVLHAADGAVADVVVPFPPLAIDEALRYGGLVEHVQAERTVGVLLVRRGGHAAGVFTGAQLVASKVGSRHVQGRSAAGGWSQQRFARRREGQARVATDAAVETAAGVLLPVAGDLDAVVLGGDRRSVAGVLDDPRLAVLRPLVVEPHLDVPDPRLKVLDQTPAMFLRVRIKVVDPQPS
jgi:hypothetical protein